MTWAIHKTHETTGQTIYIKKEGNKNINLNPISQETNQESSTLSEQSQTNNLESNALKRKKIKYTDLKPALTKVNDLVASEIDLEDIEIDINDEKTKKDLDGNGDKILYSCSFNSENREQGMLESGDCEDIGDVNFYFDKERGKLTWVLNEPGSMISGIYNFIVEGTDGRNKDVVNFKIIFLSEDCRLFLDMKDSLVL